MSVKVIDRILHLSDLHFGASDPDECWKYLTQAVLDLDPLPSAVMVTGDFSIHPDAKQLAEARTALNELCRCITEKRRLDTVEPVALLACPGNHDLLRYGNFGRANVERKPHFYESFGDCFTKAPRYRWIHLSEVSLCVTAIDTVEDSRHLAMGRVSESDARKIEGAFSAADKEHCIGRFDAPRSAHRPTSINVVLMHHSVITPTQWLEPGDESQGVSKVVDDIKGLFHEMKESMTRMNQAGAVADRLSREFIDLVLHGHDHDSCVAYYSRTSNGKSGIQFLGTTSSTGTVTSIGHPSLHAWDPKKAGFDTLDFTKAGEVLHVRHRSRVVDNDMRIEADDEPELVFAPKNLRRSMFHRARRSLQYFQQLPGDVRLHRQFRITRDGDVSVMRTFSGLQSRDSDSCTVVAFADDPTAVEPSGGHAVDEAGLRFPLRMSPFRIDTSRSGRYLSEVDMSLCPSSIREVELGYVIRGAICMNRDDLAARLKKFEASRQKPDPFLEVGMELAYSSIHAPPLARAIKQSDLDRLVPKYASLSVHFEDAYWPRLDRSKIRVFARAEPLARWRADDLLTSRLYWLPDGVMITVAYPALGGAYGIAWEVP